MSAFLNEAYYTYFIAKRKHESFSEFTQFGEYMQIFSNINYVDYDKK